MFLVSSLWGSATFTVKADVTEESIKEKENQISNAKKERDSLKNAKTDLEKVKKQLETSKSNLNAYISQIDASFEEQSESFPGRPKEARPPSSIPSPRSHILSAKGPQAFTCGPWG